MRFLLAAALVLAALPAAAASGGPAAVFGPVEVPCGICHLDRLPAPDTEEINFARLRREEAGAEGVCYSCHNGTVLDSRAQLWGRFQHPTGVRPANGEALRRAGFVLDGRGLLFCGSCHTPHVKGAGAGFFMRFPNDGGGYCRRCHPTRGAGSRFGEHDLAKVPGRTRGRIEEAGGSLDSGTISCVTCHRIHGAGATDLLVLSPWGVGGLCQDCHRPMEGNSHPLNVKPAKGVSLEWSRNGISLSPSGQVDCWSCHRAHGNAETPGLLVRELYRGNGCARCHEDKGSFEGGRGNHPVTVSPGSEKERVTCLSCHKAHKAPGNRALLTFPQGENAPCLKCHPDRGAGSGNHPFATSPGGRAAARIEELGGVLAKGPRVGCQTCHRLHGAPRATPALVAEERMLCLYCHPAQNSLEGAGAAPGTHPVLVPAGGRVPQEVTDAGGRLGPLGEIICTTCHRVHGAPQQAGLVLPPGRMGCSLCHPEQLRKAGEGHGPGAAATAEGDPGESCGSCHRAHRWAVTAAEGPDDLVTRLCRGCHQPDGEAALAGPGQGVSHPLGAKPPPPRGPSPDLPLFLADGRRFRLGVVSCATCHDVHGSVSKLGKALLRRPLTGEGSLCLACHPEQETLVGTRHDLTRTAPEEPNLAGVKPTEGGVCSPCHSAHGGFERTMWSRLLDGRGDVSSQFCRSCHAEGQVGGRRVPGPFSHPVGERQTGTVACTSCHEPHRWDPADPARRGDLGTEGDNADSFLRWPDDAGSSLCLRCHETLGAMAGGGHDLRPAGGGATPCGSPGGGTTLCGSCHRVHGGGGPLGWPDRILQGGDPISGACLSCHGLTGCAAAKPGDGGHPVGVDGPRGARVPLFGSDGRRLSRGVVTCATCHDPHMKLGDGGKGETGTLRLEAAGHAPLCTECHRKEALVAGTDHDLRVTAPESRNVRGRTPKESGLCGVCHGAHRAGGPGWLWNREEGPGYDAGTALCTGCHAAGKEAPPPVRYDRHYLDLRQAGPESPRRLFSQRRGRSASNTLPVFTREGDETDRGLITCVTCHDPHHWDPGEDSPGPGIPQDGGKGDSFLRVEGSFAIKSSLCGGCHPDDALERFGDYHNP